MRRVVVYPGRIAVEAADVPAPGPGEALVRTLAGAFELASSGDHVKVLVTVGQR
jgi:hypothetical protein